MAGIGGGIATVVLQLVEDEITGTLFDLLRVKTMSQFVQLWNGTDRNSLPVKDTYCQSLLFSLIGHVLGLFSPQHDGQ